ncbi:uncharacterized protein LOC117170561 isoform X3 [Belonocnema kinseyi]|uniref:uncharacterized protein LOC117170561 isoform X3 n=1 Tax=Belonocnema kinseyi TaxID=2817044 RepID=UPI00143D35D7|nr:uncharacterized protein LOC117170561 isoform X3 [Belonocnema kinseyi]
MAIGYFILFLCALATTNAISTCNGDSDCPDNQYCYDVSQHCVNYTKCSRYNRHEGKDHARHPSQCGSCLSGYTAEILSTGETADVCSKTLIAQNGEESIIKKKPLLIWLGSATAICIIAAIIFLILMKKRTGSLLNAHMRDNGCRTWTNIFGPSAPPLETGAFIEVGESQPYSAITNNNHNYMDKNKLVSATPFNSPDWIKSNPDYDVQVNDSLDIPEQPASPPALPPEEDTNPSSWTPQQTTGPISSRPFSQFSAERDNAMNAVLVQRNCPTATPISENGDSTSEATDSQSHSDHRGPNILISQKITMNVNVLNGDF